MFETLHLPAHFTVYFFFFFFVTVVVTVPVQVDTQVLEHSLAPSTEGLVQFRLQVVYPSVLILKPYTKDTRTVGHVLGLRYSPVS